MKKLCLLLGLSILVKTCIAVPIVLHNNENKDLRLSVQIAKNGIVETVLPDNFLRANSDYKIAEVGHGTETVTVTVCAAWLDAGEYKQIGYGILEKNATGEFISAAKKLTGYGTKPSNMVNLLADMQTSRYNVDSTPIGEFVFYPSGTSDANASRGPRARRDYRVNVSSEDIHLFADAKGNIQTQYVRR